MDGNTEETREIVGLVVALFSRLADQFNACFAELGVGQPHATALLLLDEPLSQRQLADRLKCDASHVTSIVDGLEERGLVERRVDPADRRVNRLVVTDEGRLTLERMRKLFDRIEPVHELSGDERRQFRDLLAKMVDAEETAWLWGAVRARA